MAYTSRLKKNLPIYGIKNKDLREFTTTEKDRDKGISRIPLTMTRLREEDVVADDDDSSLSLTVDSPEALENYA